MGKQSKSSSASVRNSERKNGKAFKKNPESNPDTDKAKGRGGYSFKGKFPEKAEAWNYLERKRSRSAARKFKAKLLADSRKQGLKKKEKKEKKAA